MEVIPGGDWRTEAIEVGLRAPAVPGAGEGAAVPEVPRYPPFRVWQDEREYARLRTEGLIEADIGASTLRLSAVLDPRTPAEELSFASTTVHRAGRRTAAETSVVDRLPLSGEQ